MKGIDCYGPLDSNELQSLKQNGVTHVGRYLGYKTHGWSKAMTADEARRIIQAGFHILSVWEGAPTHASYFTHAQGVQDAQDAVTDAKYVGQPAGTAIYFTVDYDAQDSDMAAIRAYLDGVRSAIGPYKVGIYGGYRVLSNVAADYYWQTHAWSYGKISPRAHVYQSQCDTHLGGVSVDLDTLQKSDCGAWPVPQAAEVKPPGAPPRQSAPPPAPAPQMPTVKLGDKNDAVKRLQQLLGFEPAACDGIFGPRTLTAVKNFQNVHHLTMDGVVGPQTWAVLLAKK